MNWIEFLTPYQADGAELCSAHFLRRWGGEEWKPTDDDRKAAAMLHTQITSRITTQRLGYLEGVETTALESVHDLFQKTRDISDHFPGCRHFDALAWEVLNIRVRPFTARWHRESERGVLAALDSTDEFRSQLTQLQPVLRRFDDLLVHLRDDHPPPPVENGSSDRDNSIAEEMGGEVSWGIPIRHGGIDPEEAQKINECEREAILARRSHYGIKCHDPNATALALSGGGIRSATFSLGVLVALAGRGLLPQVDYLSTVSGGGYLGSFLSAFLNSTGGERIGLRRDELPFCRKDGEAAALRHIRHHSKYLATGSLWQRVTIMCAQLFGMALNGLAIVFLVVLGVTVERWLRSVSALDGVLRTLTIVAAVALAVGALAALLTMRVRGRWQRYADRFVAVPSVVLLVLLCLQGLEPLRVWFQGFPANTMPWLRWSQTTWLAIAGSIPVIASALNGLFGRLLKQSGAVLVAISGVAAPVFFFGLYLAIFEVAGRPTVTLPYLGTVATPPVQWAIVAAGSLIYLLLLDINFTSPHRHYRDKLAEAFLIQPNTPPEAKHPFDSGVSVRLSDLSTTKSSPYHLLNCALNVPGSKNIEMQGRLTDFFIFSQNFCGSPLTGYLPTKSWEELDPHLDLGTAMAISAAAAAPQMGLGTMKTLSFWLALLNIRLGYWARNPSKPIAFGRAPGLWCLLKEMLGTMDEHLPWLNLTDGGHIENLGVYELLRRRCKYIIAIDGEEDSKMTFHALTTLQRLAAIDLGIRIDIDLDDLRLNEHGLSRSHFRFCRIRYPIEGRGFEDQFGYLLYIKLSLTGNEGEFLRRHRLDDPVFPHNSTADQFFSETQFEAYRSLGEHVGDKLFLRPIIGDLADSRSLDVEQLFLELGKSLLDPLPSLG